MSYINDLIKRMIYSFPETSERLFLCCSLIVISMQLYDFKKLPQELTIRNLLLAIFYINGEDVFYMHEDPFYIYDEGSLPIEDYPDKDELKKILMRTLTG